MCLAVPGRVIEIGADDNALVDFSGVRKAVSLALVEGVAPGDYVLVHVGFALHKIDPVEAERTLALIAEMAGESEAHGGPR